MRFIESIGMVLEFDGEVLEMGSTSFDSFDVCIDCVDIIFSGFDVVFQKFSDFCEGRKNCAEFCAEECHCGCKDDEDPNGSDYSYNKVLHKI